MFCTDLSYLFVEHVYPRLQHRVVSLRPRVALVRRALSVSQ